MFNFKEVSVAVRSKLKLPARGRLSQEQSEALTNELKSRWLDYLAKNDIISQATANVAHNASFPTNDPNYLSRQEGLKAQEMHASTYNSEGGPLLEKLANLEFHDGAEEWIIEEPTAVAARAADGVETRGRKAGTKNRDKETIAAEKAAKAIRVEARKTLGFTPRGRLNPEQSAALEAYIAKHS